MLWRCTLDRATAWPTSQPNTARQEGFATFAYKVQSLAKRAFVNSPTHTGIRRCSPVCRRYCGPGRSVNCETIQPQNFTGCFSQGFGN
nr:unnamed protein product [Callosobruchus chinensis]